MSSVMTSSFGFFVTFEAHIKKKNIIAETVQWGFLVSVQQVAVGVDVIFVALLLQWLDPNLILQETCPPTDWQYFLLQHLLQAVL